MTAEVLQMPDRSGRTNDQVRRSVRALLSGNGMKVEELAEAVGMPASTLYSRLAARGHRKPFSIGETDAIAHVFGVQVQDLVDGKVTLTGAGSSDTHRYRNDRVRKKSVAA